MVTAMFAGMSEAQPTPEEQATLESAYLAYFESLGIRDLPPGAALVAAVGIYALPRLIQPKARENLKAFGRRLVDGFKAKPAEPTP